MEPLLLILLVAIGVVVCLVIAVRLQRVAFRERFPPISDAEFLARCPLGTNSEVALKVRRIVADALGVEKDCIYPSIRFIEDIGTD